MGIGPGTEIRSSPVGMGPVETDPTFNVPTMKRTHNEMFLMPHAMQHVPTWADPLLGFGALHPYWCFHHIPRLDFVPHTFGFALLGSDPFWGKEDAHVRLHIHCFQRRQHSPCTGNMHS